MSGRWRFRACLPPPCQIDWCEIEEGKDFFLYRAQVDWIIGNPPYSGFLAFLKHSFSLAENVVYLVPTNKIFQSWKVMDAIIEYGGVKGMLIYGSGHLVGFPFGFSVGAFHFQRGYRGDTRLAFMPPSNKRFHRDRAGGPVCE
jgi:hypothetical protein